MKKYHFLTSGKFFLLIMVILFTSCGKKYGHYYMNFSKSIDHELLYHPAYVAQATASKQYGKQDAREDILTPLNSIPPNP